MDEEGSFNLLIFECSLYLLFVCLQLRTSKDESPEMTISLSRNSAILSGVLEGDFVRVNFDGSGPLRSLNRYPKGDPLGDTPFLEE